MKPSTPALALLLAACGGDPNPDQGVGTELSIDVCAPGGTFSPNITNPFFPMPVGQKLILQEPGGGARVEISSLAETETISGVVTRVVHEYETEDGVLVEQSWNYFAQAPDGTVCYFGERVDIYENGVVVAHDGQWRAEGGFLAGIQMPADPMAGTYHAQEVAPGVAEDFANIVARNKPTTVPYGSFTDTVHTSEWTPLEPGHLSAKSYAAGVGLLDDNGAVLISIEAP